MTPSQEEKAKTILTGRIYPAIAACVGNRYKIVLSFFAYYSFILNAKEVRTFVKQNGLSLYLYVSLLFTFFIVHNWLNYFFNAKEEIKLEEGRSGCKSAFCASLMETLFAVVSLIMV